MCPVWPECMTSTIINRPRSFPAWSSTGTTPHGLFVNAADFRTSALRAVNTAKNPVDWFILNSTKSGKSWPGRRIAR
jgi:hypothetical protein